MKLVLLGPPGAGKGTQCQRLIQKYSLIHLSSGDIFRSEISSGTELGIQAKKFIDAGNLVPDEVVIGMMIAAIGDSDNYVLDGFPRTVVQAQELDKALAVTGSGIEVVINLVVDDNAVASRLMRRRTCPICGKVYHLDYLKPKISGVCDNDSGKLCQRDDDKEDVIIDRLKTYHELTEPLVEYYNSRNCSVFNVDAGRDIEEITAEIIAKIESL